MRGGEQMPRRPLWPSWYVDEALGLFWAGLSSPEVATEMERRHEDYPGGHADKRTLLTWAASWPEDKSGRWTVTDAVRSSPDDIGDVDPALVLPVLARLVTQSAGHRRFLTRWEAQYLTRFRRIAPDLDLWKAWRLARRAASAKEVARQTPEIDVYLAFAPWRGEPQPYIDAVEAGWFDGLDFEVFATTYVRGRFNQSEKGTAGARGNAHGVTAVTEDGTR